MKRLASDVVPQVPREVVVVEHRRTTCLSSARNVKKPDLIVMYCSTRVHLKLCSKVYPVDTFPCCKLTRHKVIGERVGIIFTIVGG